MNVNHKDHSRKNVLREKISTGLPSHGHPLNCHAGP